MFVDCASAAPATPDGLDARRRGADPPWGRLEYVLLRARCFETPEPIPEDWSEVDDVACLGLADLFSGKRLAGDDACSVGDFLAADASILFANVLDVEKHAVDCVVSELCSVVIRRVPLGKRLNFAALVSEQPPPAWLHQWRREAIGVQRRQDPPAEDPEDVYKAVLLELPKKRRRTAHGKPDEPGGEGLLSVEDKLDPVRLVRALNFAKYIKCTSTFGPAVRAATAYENDEDTSEDEPQPRPRDPGTSTLVRGKARADVVAMIIARREVHALLAAGRIRSATINTDASPVLGTEVQGMVADVVLTDNAVTRYVLPGSSLCYGHYDAVSKTVCLVHCFFLCSVPTRRLLRPCATSCAA